MLIGLLWPLAVVSFWAVVFLSAIFLAARFSRMPDAADGGSSQAGTPIEAQGAVAHAAVNETGP